MALQLCVCVYICIYIAYIYASEEGILHVMGVTAHTRQAPHPLNAIRGPCPQAQEVDRKEMSPGNLRSDEAPDSNGRSQLPNSSLQSFLTHCFGCVSPIWAVVGGHWVWTVGPAPSSCAGFSGRPGSAPAGQRQGPLSTQPCLFWKERLGVSALSFSSSCFPLLTLLLVIKISPGVKPEGSWMAMV